MSDSSDEDNSSSGKFLPTMLQGHGNTAPTFFIRQLTCCISTMEPHLSPQTNHSPFHPTPGLMEGGSPGREEELRAPSGWPPVQCGGSCVTLWPGQCLVSCWMAQGFCTTVPGPRQGGPSPDTLHTRAALGENFIPWDVLASYLLGVTWIPQRKLQLASPYFKMQSCIKRS